MQAAEPQNPPGKDDLFLSEPLQAEDPPGEGHPHISGMVRGLEHVSSSSGNLGAEMSPHAHSSQAETKGDGQLTAAQKATKLERSRQVKGECWRNACCAFTRFDIDMSFCDGLRPFIPLK